MDDLTRMVGVGEATAARLRAGGLSTFESLIMATDQEILAAAGSRYSAASWREKARAAAASVRLEAARAEAEEEADGAGRRREIQTLARNGALIVRVQEWNGRTWEDVA